MQSNGAVAKDSIYLFGGSLKQPSLFWFSNALSLLSNDMWQLNMKSRVWSHSWNSFAPSPRIQAALAVVHSDLLVLFGGARSNSPKALTDPRSVSFATNDTWLYFTSVRRWAQYVSSTSPSARVASSLTGLANGSLLLFGGFEVNSGEAVNDLWLLDICQTKFYSTTQYCNGWHRVGPHTPSQVTWPSSRYSHGAATVEDSVVIVGGKVNVEWLLDIWQYNSTTSKWIKHMPRPNPKSPPYYGGVYVTAIGWKLVVITQDLSFLSLHSGLVPGKMYEDGALGGGVISVYSV